MNAPPMLTALLLEEAQAVASVHGESMMVALQRIVGCAPDVLVAQLEMYTGLRAVPLVEMEAMAPDFSRLGYSECLQRECIVLTDAAHQPTFVSGNPLDKTLSTWASYRLSGYFQIAFAHPLELKSLLVRLEGHQQAMAQLIGMDQGATERGESEEISLMSIAKDESQVVRLVNSTLYDAHKSKASDIHFGNTPQGLVIKYRIDGMLAPARRLPDMSVAEQVISRIKVMAELDIGEKRIPQDGRFAVTMHGKEIDFRVSIMPGLFGEDAVLRILDKQSLSAELSKLSLETLDIDQETSAVIRRLANQPHGMLLVTGPTGSGKTTTLYATLSEINGGEEKIVTIEDPVEYQLPDVLQIPVSEKKGLTFARGLRSILRHDPDRILVGEIRDRETAEIAVQAALTGHLVYTTVHANNVFDVLSRFRHMGVDAYSFITALNGVVAQRLLRLVCVHCAEPYTPSDALLQASGITRDDIAGHMLKHGRGCAGCRGTGYQGRRALAEVLVLTDEIRELMLQQSPIGQLKALAMQQGMRPMREQALDVVRCGSTTLEEINRVTFVA